MTDKRDELLDAALGSVLAAHLTGTPGLLPEFVLTLETQELQRFTGRLALLAAWAITTGDAQELANTVEQVQRNISKAA
ncbi:hypothetical protein [Cellulosimicrobium sp. I38E]|uniref:hypothetical protein n=1 Tax=Cellulosimicrobium sp. I38E TaxID=1393139 RepID=UPI0012E8E53F|nr:hypothetical protein [Cellulosimicrobium sp. I38E]